MGAKYGPVPEFKLAGKFTEKWARVDNSVPPFFMRAIARHIRLELLAGRSEAAV